MFQKVSLAVSQFWSPSSRPLPQDTWGVLCSWSCMMLRYVTLSLMYSPYAYVGLMGNNKICTRSTVCLLRQHAHLAFPCSAFNYKSSSSIWGALPLSKGAKEEEEDANRSLPMPEYPLRRSSAILSFQYWRYSSSLSSSELEMLVCWGEEIC